MAVINQPRTQLLNDVTFTDPEVAALAAYFPPGPSLSSVRTTPLLQKALRAQAIQAVGGAVYLTKDGVELTGLTDYVLPAPEADVVPEFTPAEIETLQALFPVSDFALIPAIEIRKSSALKKGIQAKLFSSIAVGTSVRLSLTQRGIALLRKK